MARSQFPFHVDDIAALARSLARQWAEHGTPPGHVETLNMLARAAGFQNFQHFRAEAEAQQADAALLAPSATPPAEDIVKSTKRLLRHFDAEGRLMRWPNKHSEQQPCLWTIWARIPARRTMTEREMNEAIKLGEAIGDHVLLRRELVGYGMIERTLDGSVYKRVEQPVPPESLELVREALRRGVA
ncbi:MAG: DUF2087 domain-containing protein [Burkholderiales bacterium]|nr:DUF2087 domain-containing protein [Burkholderiales bacterium]